jgi:calcineurin-like phosphoesterase family protein
MTIFFTSDTHFYHENVIKYSKRPFKNADHMNEEMIRRWNERVKPTDEVYHNGDAVLGGGCDPTPVLSRLNGIIHLTPGNHDSKKMQKNDRWASVCPYREIKLDGKFIVLCHYAMKVWNKSHYGSLMLYGHSHGSLPGNNQSLDIGVDCWDYRPVTLHEILSRMATLPPYLPVDHHGRDQTETDG